MRYPITLTETFPENWPLAFVEAAAPMHSVKLSKEDVLVLGSQSKSFRDTVGDFRSIGFSDAFMQEIAIALATYPGGVMPRLGFCSWKGSMLGNPPLRSVAEVMQVMTREDPRVAESLEVHALGEETALLHLREWRHIPEWSEFRVFVKGRKVAGVSQYHWRSQFPEIPGAISEIKQAIKALLQSLWEFLHLDDVVIDLYVAPGDGGAGQMAAHLVELNPFSARTDACLYSWKNGGDFDGGLRYNHV